MGPVPEENQNNPADKDLPQGSDSEELETPNHVIPPADDSSSDEDEGVDSDGEGPANEGYMLLPQEPEEEGGGDGLETFPPHPFPPLSALEGEALPAESMTEVRGSGVDVSQAVAVGSVHPAFAASFRDNKVPVHLQVPDLPKTKKEDVLWNHASPEANRLHLDSAQLSKVKAAMAGFQLPKANIPDWAHHVPEDQWKQQLVNKLASPVAADTSSGISVAGPSRPKDVSDAKHHEDVENERDQCPGASGT